MKTPLRAASAALVALAMTSATVHATEDIEFVAEHLPEAAMDNRYAALPVWGVARPGNERREIEAQAAYATTQSGNLEIRGPLASLGAEWWLDDRWHLGAFAFYDRLALRADHEQRDLQTLFAPSTPIARPVAAQLTHLDGRADDFGVGAYVKRCRDGGWLGAHSWVGGLMVQRMQLTDYRFDYRLLAGAQAGSTGQIDFDAHYDHLAPFLGLEVVRQRGAWAMNAHVLAVYPLPRRGFVGHIDGPGFDIHGDTQAAGNGKHFGDPSLTLGYNVTYLPAHLSIDLGTLASQALLESRIHKGIDRNLTLSFTLSF